MPNKKERLNCPDLFIFIFENEEVVLESVRESGANELVEPVVLKLVLKRFLPGRAIMQFGERDNGREAVRDSDGFAG